MKIARLMLDGNETYGLIKNGNVENLGDVFNSWYISFLDEYEKMFVVIIIIYDILFVFA